MIITLEPDATEAVVKTIFEMIARFEGITPRKHVFQGEKHTVTEIALIGSGKLTLKIPDNYFDGVAGVRRVVRISSKYRLIGRPSLDTETAGFEYNGVSFNDRSINLFAGLCAVDTLQHVEQMMSGLKDAGLKTTRMGAYKPRTSPYEFQGLGKSCLPWVFELAGKYDVKVVSMEVTDARHIDEIQQALNSSGNATGVMLQIGTRNAQNFELLKQVGQQQTFPVLFKRGMGITLEESLNACEYIASEGNPKIVFCLRGVKTHLGDPHRNFVDFAHVPVVRRQTRLPVCVDPSHSVGRPDVTPDGIPDIFHVLGQGFIAGATMGLIDFHPHPEAALCDGGQAFRLDWLPNLIRYSEAVRRTYENLVQIVA